MNVLNTKTLILKHLGPQSIIVSHPLRRPKSQRGRDLSLQPPSHPTHLPRDRVTNPTQTPAQLRNFRFRQDERSLIYFTLFFNIFVILVISPLHPSVCLVLVSSIPVRHPYYYTPHGRTPVPKV